ncbi:MAG: hypothetical protein A3I70_00575 [Deltaproteobacteria bacterium RIFCSPLOWO2_02_FULL_44_34]|nr:MAG: hypothetical protein A3I70_00575 [Deltaproteobacteria bacterium RIFCSPLOWO2_02_FULL_44_34]
MIADKSVLAHNVYKMLLKPLGFSLFFYKTLHDLKQNFDSKLSCDCFLINSNALGTQWDRTMTWLKEETKLKAAPKVFLCDEEEKAIQSLFKKLPNSHVVFRPFYPPALETTLKGILRERS